MGRINKRTRMEFCKTVLEHYQMHGRHDLLWRQPEGDGSFDPYKILVSEVMLQQTQVARVIPKFEQFIRLFPTIKILASASLSDVLKAWSGLGYNRRAKFLWQAAHKITSECAGQIPLARNELAKLPGIGQNTAGAITVYAANSREVFIETNIRTVYIYHFFANEQVVPDTDITELVLVTLPDTDYRQWYWALMDYGTYLKQTVGNLSRRSKIFARQSAFEGSKRQIRGQVLKLLGSGPYVKAQLVEQISDERLEQVLVELSKEGLIKQTGNTYDLP